MVDDKKIISLIENVLGIKVENVHMKLKADLGADSLDMYDLATQIQTQFGTKIPDTVLENQDNLSVMDIINVINNKFPGFENAPVIRGLYTLKNNKPICALTEKRCRKISKKDAAKNIATDLCKSANCIIAKNFYDLAQKIK